MSAPEWTADDVERVALAIELDHVPPREIMERLGPYPPDEYLAALGRRMMELYRASGERAADLEVNRVRPESL